MRALRASIAAVAGMLLLAPDSSAQAAELRPEIAEAVAEAASAVGLPERWIALVLQAESGGRAHAVSTAGAMGLMQVMPRTWRELRARLGLGADPFDVRDNVLAGAAYLREMHDRFGAPGFLAAYNAGPVRYQAHLEGRAALPRDTVAYVARIAPQLGVRTAGPTNDLSAGDWRTSGLFPASSEQLLPLANGPIPTAEGTPP